MSAPQKPMGERNGPGVIAAEAEPPLGQALGVLVHVLLRDHGRYQAVVLDSVWVERTPSTWRLRFGVEDRQRGRGAWSVVLDGVQGSWSRSAK